MLHRTNDESPDRLISLPTPLSLPLFLSLSLSLSFAIYPIYCPSNLASVSHCHVCHVGLKTLQVWRTIGTAPTDNPFSLRLVSAMYVSTCVRADAAKSGTNVGRVEGVLHSSLSPYLPVQSPPIPAFSVQWTDT